MIHYISVYISVLANHICFCEVQKEPIYYFLFKFLTILQYFADFVRFLFQILFLFPFSFLSAYSFLLNILFSNFILIHALYMNR